MSGNYTWSIFKSKIEAMTNQERKEYLDELHRMLMEERTMAAKAPIKSNHINLYHRQIACIKTIMKIPGYHYHPREI